MRDYKSGSFWFAEEQFPARKVWPVFLFIVLCLVTLLCLGCSEDLPMEPVEPDTDGVQVLVYRDSIDVIERDVDFGAIFYNRVSYQEINITYLVDTVAVDLEIFLSDTVNFSIDVTSKSFTSSSRELTVSLGYSPSSPNAEDFAQIYLSTYFNDPDNDSLSIFSSSDTLNLYGSGEGFFYDMDMVYIPSGSFLMGDGDSGDSTVVDYDRQDELYTHEVSLDDFLVGRYEVTNRQYYEFWVEESEDGDFTPEYSSVVGSWPDDAFDKPNYPVVGVNWYDALAFCDWLSLRTGYKFTLPTEAQWEYVASGGEVREYPWGGLETEPDSAEATETIYANISGSGDGYLQTAPVQSYASGQSAFGIYNLAGNVWEWCLDWYEETYYRTEPIPSDNPQGPETSELILYRVIRGGSWQDEIVEARVKNRAALSPGNKESNVGFRVVRLP